MKHRGLVAHFSELIGLKSPEAPTLNLNTLTGKKEFRWSAQTSGLVAYATIKAARPLLYNEKSIQEADCILKHSPTVAPPDSHPFTRCGARPLRRGVWFWPRIEAESHQHVLATKSEIWDLEQRNPPGKAYKITPRGARR